MLERSAPAVVADTSVVLKWYVAEADRDRALDLRQAHAQGRLRLVFLDLLTYELANVLRYKPGWDAARVAVAVDSLYGMEAETRAVSSALLEHAVRLSYAHDIAVYDAAFIALAQAEDADYVTADERLAGQVRTQVKWLRTYRVPNSA